MLTCSRFFYLQHSNHSKGVTHLIACTSNQHRSCQNNHYDHCHCQYMRITLLTYLAKKCFGMAVGAPPHLFYFDRTFLCLDKFLWFDRSKQQACVAEGLERWPVGRMTQVQILPLTPMHLLIEVNLILSLLQVVLQLLPCQNSIEITSKR